MTDRLYYKDPTLLEFDARVVDSGRINDKSYVILDRTAFYPTSGGQPHDVGTINDVEVIDVIEDENENVRHIVKREMPTGAVKGSIDQCRRHYFRQLHTAQHILSRAFIDLFEYETVSVHLGEDYGAIELATSQIASEQIQKSESLANRIVEQNQPIEIIFADEKQAAELPLRKQSNRTGTIRVIKIGETDWSACGGTHCNSTAEVALIKVIGLEKQRSNTLVRFLAGSRAKADYDQRFAVSDKMTKTLTCSVTDLPEKIEKLSHENKKLIKQISKLQQELLPIKAAALSEKAEQLGNYDAVLQIVTDIDPGQLNQLASETANKISGLVALLYENRLCLSVSSKIDLDAGKIVKQMSEKLGLKGGGGKTLAQLGGVKAEELDKYRTLLNAFINE